MTIARRKFFGLARFDVYGRQVALSTPAKTVVDCADRPDLAGGPAEVTRIVYGAMTSVDPHELAATASQMKSTALLQRLGFLADLVGWKLSDDVRGQLRSTIAKSARSAFGRSERRAGDIGYVGDWGLFVNATRNDPHSIVLSHDNALNYQRKFFCSR